MKGLIRLAQVLTPAGKENDYRCKIQAMDTLSTYWAIANPSPYGWVCPEVNALVYFVDDKYVKRIIGTLHDIDTSTRSVEDMGNEPGKEELTTSIETLNPGDVYIGKYGKAIFNNAGNVEVRSLGQHSHLRFDNTTGGATLSSDNIEIYTEKIDTGWHPVRMYTRAASGATGAIGDVLTFEANKYGVTGSTGSTGASGASGATNVNLTTIRLDNLGNFTIGAGFGPTGASGSTAPHIASTNLGVLSSGDILFYGGGSTFDDATVSGLASVKEGTIWLTTQVVGSSGASGSNADIGMLSDGSLASYVGGGSFDAAIVSSMMDQAKKEMRLKTTGSFYLDATESANITAKNLIVKAIVDSTGDFKITGKTNIVGDTTIKGKVAIEGDTSIKANSVNLDAKTINLGGDGALALVMAQKLIALFNAHTHPTTAPGAPSGPPIVPLVETQIATLVTKAK